jgi:GT2 family glycosyltransferase
MDLSIVIVNWNTREMLRDCLRSVLSGLGPLAAEILVVDNASSDGSVEMVRAEFPAVRLIDERPQPRLRGRATTSRCGWRRGGTSCC